MRKLIIAIDFDGTIVSNRYPQIGILRNGAKETINKWYEDHTIIINSCRAGIFHYEMKAFLDNEGVKYHYINENTQELIEKYNGDTRKISADLYFDDHNPGVMFEWGWADDAVSFEEHRKPVIVCVIGESGSGKSTLARKIEAEFGNTLIRSYTDRPPRDENDDHTFLSPQEFDWLDPNEYLAYTKFGDYRYCCLTTDIKDYNVYVIDEDGFEMLRNKWGDKYAISSIRLVCPEEERIKRVGPERVARDAGRFTMPMNMFDYVLRTDKEYSVSSLKNLMY